ncbi:hypothetical protein ACO2Q1_16210 [Brevundimonas sp. VNH65]|uniref:hypothetical protein n=1 Tax=Brevundimonas sp. VNH65 TaxID=3400917 RepID=UPI003BFB8951
MTSVTFRKVELGLERMVRGNRGMRPADALAAAEANLADAAPQFLSDMDAGLEAIWAFAARDPALRPSRQELDDLVTAAGAALTLSGAVGRPHLGRALVMLCALADALREADRWPTGALNPAIDFIRLIRSDSLNEDQMQALLSELDKCLENFSNPTTSA